MGSHTLKLSVLLLCCVEGGLFKQLPDYINVCKREQDTINACARHSVEALRPTLVKGIPELDVPSIDPFFIDKIVPRGRDASVVRAVGTNIKLTGASNFTIKHVDVDLDTFLIKGRVRFPKLHFDGKYKIDTRILVLPIQGEGTMSVNAVKCDAELTLYGDVKKQGDDEVLSFSKLDLDITIKDYRVTMDGLFNGDKVLGEATNQAINQNRGEFLRLAKPYIEATVSSIMLDLANKVVKDLTLDQLLPKP